MGKIVASGDAKKAYKADLELRRAEMFFTALVLVLSIVYATLGWNASLEDDDIDASLLEDIIEDIDFNPDLFMPAGPSADSDTRLTPAETAPDVADQMRVTALKEEFLTPRSAKNAELSDPTPSITIDPLKGASQEPIPSVAGLPEFPGGATALMKWITENLKYPTSARKKQGRAVARFIVDAEGNISDLKVEDATDPQFKSSVMATMKEMPQWTPGTENGTPCPWMVAIPIYFNP